MSSPRLPSLATPHQLDRHRRLPRSPTPPIRLHHPHLHVLAAHGLFTPDGRFHCMPAENLAPAIELFRHRFLHTLREAKLISPKKFANLLSWKHSGFNIHDGGEKPVAAHDNAGRKRLAEYLLRHPFPGGRSLGEDPSLQKITWNATNKTVICRSKCHHTTKRNFEIFKAPDFIAAALLHLPPKGQQTVRYFGVYSNKTRGRTSHIPDRIIRPPESSSPISNLQFQIPDPKSSSSPPRPNKPPATCAPFGATSCLQIWGGDPLQCSCCKGTMKPVRQVIRREEIQFFLRLQGLWEGLIQLPRPPPPPFDIDTMEPIEPPWQAIKEWIPDDEPDLDWFNRPRNPSNPDPDSFDQSPTWQAPEVKLDDGRTLVLEYS